MILKIPMFNKWEIKSIILVPIHDEISVPSISPVRRREYQKTRYATIPGVTKFCPESSSAQAHERGAENAKDPHKRIGKSPGGWSIFNSRYRIAR